MPKSGWKKLLPGPSCFQGEGKFPITAYSEFLPAPLVGCKPYGGMQPVPFSEDDPWGWQVTEYEEAFQIHPGLCNIARQMVTALVHLAQGRTAHGIGKNKLDDNPYWPPELAKQAASLDHERFVVLSPLALAHTLDDKGRMRWTLFGCSEQGPARAFWRSFFTAPGVEVAQEQALDFVRRLLSEVYEEPESHVANLKRAGFRILPRGEEPAFPYWREDPWPAWTEPFLWHSRQSVREVKYLLTFRPFTKLPPAVQRAYLQGDLHLLPCPGSLLFWGAQPYHWLQRELPFAMQIPLLHSIARHAAPLGIRVPQSGWLHEPRAGGPKPGVQFGPVRDTYKRTNRNAKVHRHDDELALPGREDRVIHVLFSSAPADVGLYGKPMARNAQVWTHDFHLLLDGPNATAAEILNAVCAVEEGGLFGYRFHFPPMRVGEHQVYWHRPLVAYLSAKTGEPTVVSEAPLGYLTAYRADQPELDAPIELWPRLLQRDTHAAAVVHCDHAHDMHQYRTILNIRKLLDTGDLFGHEPLPRAFARQLLTLPREESLDDWLETLPQRLANPGRGRWLADELSNRLEPPAGAAGNRETIQPVGRVAKRGGGKKEAPVTLVPSQPLPKPLTYPLTARRSFEVGYWNTIAALAEGHYVNKDNADCVNDPATQAALTHHHRDLEALGDYLLDYYQQLINNAQMKGRALAGELPFRWLTDFNFSWMGGWLNNQEGHTYERDLMVVIPGRDRRRAVIMADHYDTAYMCDRYDQEYGGNGARIAAAGADDNHSATAALMLGAPVFLDMSRKGKLACDVWLVHLTGEEFPADCLGARHLAQWLVERTLKLHVGKGKYRDLSRARVQGVYVLDMVAHNNDHDRDVFQIAPGTGRESMWLAYQAHVATTIWNEQARAWNRRPSRRHQGRGRRSADGATIPAVARHPHLSGEVRPSYDPRSTLYNTDGQIFSDAGVPVVLFMENYDINRTGYHDMHDTMENIDLDYGAAVAAIAIESVARAATETPPS